MLNFSLFLFINVLVMIKSVDYRKVHIKKALYTISFLLLLFLKSSCKEILRELDKIDFGIEYILTHSSPIYTKMLLQRRGELVLDRPIYPVLTTKTFGVNDVAQWISYRAVL